MTTFSSTAGTVGRTSAGSRGRIGLIALWVIQIAVAGMFLMAGGMKLAGAPPMVGLFDAIGIGQWFRYVTGTIEVASALALLVPSLAPFGAVLLVPTMLGAIATHLFIVGGSPAVPIILLIGSLVIAWARRDQLANAVSKLR
jgi:putative oxidoreductase